MTYHDTQREKENSDQTLKIMGLHSKLRLLLNKMDEGVDLANSEGDHEIATAHTTAKLLLQDLALQFFVLEKGLED